MVYPRHALRTDDAKNRAARTLLQGLAIDLAVAVAMAIAVILIDANSWGDLEWLVIGFTIFKTVLMTAAAFVMRQWLDKPDSVLLPPDPPGSPSDPNTPFPGPVDQPGR